MVNSARQPDTSVERTRQRAVQLGLDVLAGRLIEELERARVDVLLTKGPVTAAWLYTDDLEHPYSDIDLLVSPHQDALARSVLSQKFDAVDYHATVLGIYRPVHESAWLTALGTIDLHTALYESTRVGHISAWSSLWPTRTTLMLRGRKVQVLGIPGRSVQVVIHALGSASPKAKRDRERVLDVLTLNQWAESADLAQRIGLADELAQSLRETERGRAIAQHLRLPERRSVAVELASRTALREAFAVERVFRTRDLRQARSWLSADVAPGLARRRGIALGRLPWAGVQVLRAWARVRFLRLRRARQVGRL